MRCVFSESLNRQTLGAAAVGPPGMPPGAGQNRAETGWRAVVRVLRSTGGLARIALDDIFTTVVPADCRACGGPLLSLKIGSGNVPVCEACVDGIAAQTKTLCRRCGEAIRTSLNLEDVRFGGMLPEGLLCTPCRMVPPGFTRAVAFGEYQGEMRTLIHLLKYERMSGVAGALAPMLAEAIATLRSDAADEQLVIAVPLFAAKERQRGYNQSVLLADAALKLLRKSAPEWRLTAAHSLMLRTRPTEDQYTLSPVARRRNLRGAFTIPTTERSRIAGREVLLVDDIYTTGATARECARVLNRAGAAKVWVATLARAQAAGIEVYKDGVAEEFAGDTAAWGSGPTRAAINFGTATFGTTAANAETATAQHRRM